MLPKPEIMSHFQGDLGARHIESIAKIFIERIRSKILKAFTAILLRISGCQILTCATWEFKAQDRVNSHLLIAYCVLGIILGTFKL